MLDPGIQHITIIGPGLLGCSLGMALRARGYTGGLVGVARRQATVDAAIARGGIDAGTDDLAQACSHADLIVLATPVATVLRQIDQLAGLAPADAIVTDVGSTKRSIVLRATAKLPRFVGSHPMAGGELTGPDAARADLFQDRPCVVTPVEDTDARASQLVQDLWSGLGMRVHIMDPARHDRAVAVISHWPHLVSVMLMHAADAHGALDIASSGLADMTRLAAGDVTMWADILLDNAPAVLEAIDDWKQTSEVVADVLRAGDRPGLENLLGEARDVRMQWRPSSPGGSP